MKTSVTKNGGGFNFKKAFIIFFAALFAFLAISTLYQVGNGGWETAVNFQNRRFEARSSGDISTMLELRASRGFTRGANGAITRNPGDRILHGFAGIMTRFNMTGFNVFAVFAILFRITFVVLVISCVYVQAQNRINRYPQHER